MAKEARRRSCHALRQRIGKGVYLYPYHLHSDTRGHKPKLKTFGGVSDMTVVVLKGVQRGKRHFYYLITITGNVKLWAVDRQTSS